MLVTDEREKSTPAAETGPAHTSTCQGQTAVSAHSRTLRDLATTGHDRLVWADESATPARDDLAGLIQMFETQYDAWARTRRDLLEEIEYLRRSLDEALLKQAPGSNRGA